MYVLNLFFILFFLFLDKYIRKKKRKKKIWYTTCNSYSEFFGNFIKFLRTFNIWNLTTILYPMRNQTTQFFCFVFKFRGVNIQDFQTWTLILSIFFLTPRITEILTCTESNMCPILLPNCIKVIGKKFNSTM